MSNDFSGTDITPATVFLGLAQWDFMASDIIAGWKAWIPEIQRLSNSATWGDDTAGNAFRAAYLQGNGPNQTVTLGDSILAEIPGMGTKVRKNVENSLTTDRDQVQLMNSLQM